MTVESMLRSLFPFLTEIPDIHKQNDIYRAAWSDYVWFVPNNDPSQANWCRNFIDSHERFLDQLNHGDIIVEAGAATGEYTVEAAQHLDNGHIHAFEAEPRNYRCLEENLKHHHELEHVTPVNMALSDGSESEIRFQVADSIAEHKVSDQNVDNSDREYRNVVGDAADNNENEITVAAKTLDAYCAENDIRNIDLLKLSVNGHEATILAGARGMLQHTKYVFLNVDYDAAKDILSDMGFHQKLKREHDSLGSPQLWENSSL